MPTGIKAPGQRQVSRIVSMFPLLTLNKQTPAERSCEICNKKLKPTQLTFNCLDSAIETLEKGVKRCLKLTIKTPE